MGSKEKEGANCDPFPEIRDVLTDALTDIHPRASEDRESKDEVAKRLIDWHFKIEPEITEIYRIVTDNEDAPNEPIKLLEVSNATFETGRVDAFGFGPADDITYPSVIATVTPGELERILAGTIPLPKGWNLVTAQVFSAPKLTHAS